MEEGALNAIVPDQTTVDHMKSLHTAAIDARNGYKEALEDAEGKGMSPLFREMISLHQRHADALAHELGKAGVQPDDSGSFMSTIHKTIMDIRSLFGGLDASVLPGLIDGEKRNVGAYDDALKDALPGASLASLLAGQRADLIKKIADMEAMKPA